ncbi:putative relatd to E3-like factor in the SUMO pathway [Fusarium heterosporum]|uniref:Putative relatd to E3-like factor in the SUMO pathway n=1 Tax=Fusarium heterosporum TaxID=42747 RepID=A0A8H5WGQ4_FUSHE|nr:putative relatd to E3-like factor in the SUMO pathway [Fusarium heterosporum]
MCVTNASFKVMVFCAEGDSDPPGTAFPGGSIIEIFDVGGEAFRISLDTKSAPDHLIDITKELSLPLARAKVVQFKPGSTHKQAKEFHLVIAAFKATSIEEMERCIAKRTKIPSNFIKQGPKFCQLAVDAYLEEILSVAPEDQETVTIASDGKWHFRGFRHSSQVHKNGDSSYWNRDDARAGHVEDGVISEVNPIHHGRKDTADLARPPLYRSSMAGPDRPTTGHKGLALRGIKRRETITIDLTTRETDNNDVPPPAKRSKLRRV